jgi:hypothetical protein
MRRSCSDKGRTVYRIVAKFVLKLAMVVSPLALIPFVSNHCRDSALLRLLLGDKPEAGSVEKLVGIFLGGISITVMTVYESFAHLWPRVQAKTFAFNYVGNLFDKFAKSIDSNGVRMGGDIRVNVLFVKLCRFLLLRRFTWFANRGFIGGQKDNDLWMLTWQGLCGKAFRSENTLATDLRHTRLSDRWWPCPGNLWLFPWQREKTRHLKAILSIPIFRTTKSDAMTRHKAVGVINIDAVSDRGAEWLLKNAKVLEAFFGDRGTTLVWLSIR